MLMQVAVQSEQYSNTPPSPSHAIAANSSSKETIAKLVAESLMA
jgi:hypothetical protein